MTVLAIIFLTTLFLLQLWLPKARLNQAGFLISAFSVILVFGFAGFQSWKQYQLWSVGDTTRFLLPPYQSLDYFVYYSRYRFFNPYLVSGLMGILFFLGTRKLNLKYARRFFEDIEPYFLAVSMFVLGTPGWLVYLLVFLGLYLIVSLSITFYHLFMLKEGQIRVPLFYLWLPSAISTILISRYLVDLPLWQQLKF